MAAQLTLSDQLYARLRQLAEKQKRTVNDVAEELLEQSVSNNGITRNGTVASEAEQESGSLDDAQEDEAMAREAQAYVAMHQELKQSHLGEYVAINNGQLVDHDTDREILYARIDARFPHEFVYFTQVREEPIRTFRVRPFHKNKYPRHVACL